MSRRLLWAPRAERVRLVTDSGEIDLSRGAAGWWHAESAVPPGADYAFRLDEDRSELPDPRGRRLPGGVHARSRMFDPTAHRWRDERWTGRQLAGGLIYELHIGTFTPQGTLDAAITRFDHLVELGVTHVELLPVNAFNGEHNWGYDGVAWYAVHEAYGGPAAYQRFVDAAHRSGLAVIQDVVYNHLGPSGNHLPRFGPYLTDGRNTWGELINLDGPESDEVRRYIIDNALMWLADYHVDGLRLDAVHALRDSRAVHLLEELASEVEALSAHLGRPLSLIAESDLNDPRLITPRQAGGYGLDAVWNDDFHHVLHVALTGETTGYYGDFGSMSAIVRVLEGGYFHDGSYSSFRGRSHGRPVDTGSTPGCRFVVFLQDHDQVGNRAAGDRLCAQADVAAQLMGAVVLYTSPFTPMLFMGEEWAASTPWQFFTDHPEPELAVATATGRLKEFERMGWDGDLVADPQDPQTFHRSKLDWAEVSGDGHAEVLGIYRALGRLRRRYPDLTDPRLSRVRAVADDEARTLTVHRGRIVVVANFADRPRRVPIPGLAILLLATASEPALRPDAIELPARCAVVLLLPTQ